MAEANPFSGSLQSAAETLRKLLPVEAVVHVGSGTGLGAMHAWRNWDVSDALLIDVTPAPGAWLEASLSRNDGWRYANACVGADSDPLEFHVASNPAESGMIAPERLSVYWPNLTTIAVQSLPGVTLDSVVAEARLGAAPNWLFIDCLPALPVLMGAETVIDACSVIWLRAVLVDDERLAGATLGEVAQFLRLKGFRQLSFVEGNHPAVGEALFARDWQQRLKTESECATNKYTALQTISEQQRGELERAARLALIQENVSKRQLTQIAALQNDAAALKQAHDRLAEDLAQQQTLASERATALEVGIAERGQLQAQIAALTESSVKQSSQLSSLQAQLDTRTLENKELTTSNSDLVVLRDTQNKLAAERQASLGAMSAELSRATAESTAFAAALEEQKSLVADRQSEIDAKAEEMAVLRAEHGRAAAERAALAAALEEQKSLVAGRQSDIDAKAGEMAALSAEHVRATAKCAALVAAFEEQKSLVAGRRSELDAKAAEMAALNAEINRLGTELAARVAAGEDQKAVAAQCQRDLDAKAAECAALSMQNNELHAERDTLTTSTAARQARVDQLSAEKDVESGKYHALATAHEELNQLFTEREVHILSLNTQHADTAAQLAKREQRVAVLEQELAAALRHREEREAQYQEMLLRQQMMQEELIKAEAQIQLISDLLLRDPGL